MIPADSAAAPAIGSMNSDAPHSVAHAIRARALALGFERAGFCDAVPPEEIAHFERWLAAGMHGHMSWMQKGRERRLDPALVLASVRSIIVVAMSYARPGSDAPATATPDGISRGVVSRYARGDDYHDTVGARLLNLEEFIEQAAPGHRAMAYVDTGPILERMWAARAGVGWIGKNALVLNKEMGSLFFLGVILTTLPLPADVPVTDQCGACTLCIEACPTAAIVEPRLVDSRRCISYHTIELRVAIPEEYREPMGSRVFGCDDCQDACPWNQHAADAPPRGGSAFPSLLELLAMSREQYQDRFRGSAIKRATYRGLRRNVAVALGNAAARQEHLGALDKVAADSAEDPLVREHAGWAAARQRAGVTS